MLDLAEMNEGEKLTKEKGGLTASLFFLVGVIRLELHDHPDPSRDALANCRK